MTSRPASAGPAAAGPPLTCRMSGWRPAPPRRGGAYDLQWTGLVEDERTQAEQPLSAPGDSPWPAVVVKRTGPYVLYRPLDDSRPLETTRLCACRLRASGGSRRPRTLLCCSL